MVVETVLQVDYVYNKNELEDMITKLVKDKELKTKDYEERMNICSIIRQAFVEAGFSNCLVYPYGSTINGVGFYTSDLDLYVDLGVFADTLKMSEILRKNPDFINIEAVPNARVPIVKAVHVPSGISCDLSFGNKASLWNTEFIQFCCLSDPRVRPLIMLVRYWGRMHGLVGREGSVRICNYALTMLVIAYLQQIPCPILHSVQQLLKCTDVDLAPSSFCSHLLAKAHELPVLYKNPASVSDLLLGFFDYYSRLQYSNNVISIFLGNTCHRDELVVENMIKSNTPLCLQDPFELNFNICRNISENGLGVLICHFHEGYKLIRKIKLKKCDDSYSTFFRPFTHTKPLADCNGCMRNNKSLINLKAFTPSYNHQPKLPQYMEEYNLAPPQYMPSMEEYNLAVLRSNLAQRMPPWWRKWRGLS